MNEEIVVRIGGSLDGFATALRGMKPMVTQAASGLKDSFKDIFSGLSGAMTGAFTIGGSIAEFQHVFEKVEQIKRSAETMQVSTQFVQGLNNVGKAAGISSDEIESMMDKLLKTLPEGSDVEQAFYDLADKIKSIPDPAERARLAIEEFGKAGVKMIPILEQGSDGIRKMAKGFSDLSDDEIEAVENGKQYIEKYAAALDKFFAEAIYGYTKLAQVMRNLPNGKELLTDLLHGINPISEALDKSYAEDVKKMIEDGKRDKEQKAAASGAADADAANQEYNRAMEALDKFQQKKAQVEFANADPKKQLAILQLQEQELWNEGQMTDNQADQLDILTEIEDVHGKILETKKKIAEQDKTEAQKQKELSEQIMAAQIQIAQLQGTAANTGAQFPSLQQVANSGQYVVSGSATIWKPGPNAREAQEVTSSSPARRPTALTEILTQPSRMNRGPQALKRIYPIVGSLRPTMD